MCGENGEILGMDSGGGAFGGRVACGGSFDGDSYGGGRRMRFGKRERVVVFVGVSDEEVCRVHTASFNLLPSGTPF